MDGIYEVIGIDHGWSYIKTVSGQFITGVKEMSTEPALKSGLLEYEGRYYKIGSKRLDVTEKVANENFWLLTLAGIATELKKRGKTRANILLSAGVPLATFGKDKKPFQEYLSRQGEIRFTYEGTTYIITIGKVMITPQCYAAVVEQLGRLPKNPIVVDIGSWTVDILPIVNGVPDEAQAVTIPNGLITCMRNINGELVRKLGKELSELELTEVMMGETSGLSDRYLEVVEAGLAAYTESVEGSLVEHSFNLDTRNIIYVGGGARVMKQYGTVKGRNITYIEDVKANAKGFEYLGRMKARGGRQ